MAVPKSLIGLLILSIIILAIGIGLMTAQGINLLSGILSLAGLVILVASIYGIYNRIIFDRSVGRWMDRTSKTYNPKISFRNEKLNIEDDPTSIYYKSNNR